MSTELGHSRAIAPSHTTQRCGGTRQIKMMEARDGLRGANRTAPTASPWFRSCSAGEAGGPAHRHSLHHCGCLVSPGSLHNGMKRLVHSVAKRNLKSVPYKGSSLGLGAGTGLCPVDFQGIPIRSPTPPPVDAAHG